MRKLVCSSALVVLLAGCATVRQGPLQRIAVDSNPTGASVQLTGCGAGSSARATTPATVFVNRKATQCALAFTLPDHNSRTIPLFRKYSAATEKNVKLVDNLCKGENCNDPAGVLRVAALGAVVLGATFGIDRVSGAMFEQNRSAVHVDFTQPAPLTIAATYSLASVNGEIVPAKVMDLPWGGCHLRAISGSLALEPSGRWRATLTEQEVCGSEAGKPMHSTGYGVYSVRGETFLLESETGVDLATVRGDSLDLTFADQPRGDVFTFVPLNQPVD